MKTQFWSLFYLTLSYQQLCLSNHIPKYDCDLFFETYFKFWEIQLFLKTGWRGLKTCVSQAKIKILWLRGRVNYRDVFILSRRLFWPSRERNVGSACVPLLCFCGNERWEEGRRKLFFSSFSWTSRFLSSLSLKKFTPFNKVHRFTQKWLSSLIGCCWHMLKATFKANTYFFISQTSIIKWLCLSQQGIYSLGPLGLRGHRQILVESPGRKGLKFKFKLLCIQLSLNLREKRSCIPWLKDFLQNIFVFFPLNEASLIFLL